MSSELIAEARKWEREYEGCAVGECCGELADALEAATRERATVPDAANEERLRSMTGKRNRARLNGDRYRLERDAARAERDAALAALERVRAEADAYAEQSDVMEPCGAVAQALRTALDGAPEPEWGVTTMNRTR